MGSRSDDRYIAEIGEPRNLPDDHPDLWQWLYRGLREERESLLAMLAEEDATVVEEPQAERLFE
jgi:hypothetical protein